MTELTKVFTNVVNVKDVSEAFGDAIKKHPEKALIAGSIICGLYLLKDKKIKFKLKKSDLDIEFETE